MVKYNIETKIEAIRLYKSGIGSTTIARKLRISEESTVLNGVRLWEKHGLSGIVRSKTLPSYFSSFKMKVITWLVKHRTSYSETAAHFDAHKRNYDSQYDSDLSIIKDIKSIRDEDS
ncbi:helix-turn-helix domain-containing protein [Companilactobacillus kimchiensis]|uniref:Transposase n=1 Tax=Companilactobacillus kimchiensis TaxID=993692 RepID=A0A0R2LL80_9LACO|nr:transposase [Companilactobacillus kimchiensis]KRN99405.1 hypothetical protein IV57_GL002528 [Companilactobacillus kimchiensis]